MYIFGILKEKNTQKIIPVQFVHEMKKGGNCYLFFFEDLLRHETLYVKTVVHKTIYTNCTYIVMYVSFGTI